jgi:SAM-dependent methyltransferase
VEPAEYDQLAALDEDHWRARGIRGLVGGALRGGLAAPGAGPPRVLEAGCGTGGLADALRDTARVVAVDAHPLAIAHAHARGVARLARADVQRLPFADASFDAAVSIDVLYHRAVGDDAAALREIARVVRPGGGVLLFLAAYEWMRSSHDLVVHTARRYTRARLVALADAAGLAVERASYWNSALLPAAALRRAWRGNHAAAESDFVATPHAINELMARWLALESALALRVPLPFGLSVFGVLRKG